MEALLRLPAEAAVVATSLALLASAAGRSWWAALLRAAVLNGPICRAHCPREGTPCCVAFNHHGS